jgi:hypothetical protein
MNRFKKMLALLLSILMVNLFFFGTCFAQQSWYSTAEITEHTPVVRALPEEKIPVEVVKEGGGSAMLWALLGVVAIGGVVAAAGGGGSSGGGGGGDEPPSEEPPSEEPPSEPDTGTVSVSW